MKYSVYARIVQGILVPLLFLTIAWQTRHAFFNSYEVYDYLIPFVYLSDLFIIGILVTETVMQPRWLLGILSNKWIVFGLVLLTGSIGVSIVNGSIMHSVGFWYNLIKLILLFMFSLWIIEYRKRYSITRIMALISIGLLPLILLGGIEMVLGKTLGLTVFGEWTFSRHLPGVATVFLFDTELLRPYATFPHPNVFGAIMGLFAIYWMSWLAVKNDRSIVVKRVVVAILGLLLLGVVLSFSRSVWGALIVAAGYIFVVAGLERRVSTLPAFIRGVAIILSIGVLVLFFMRLHQLFDVDSLSFARRWELNRVALDMFTGQPLFGVGLNQFLLHLDSYWNITGLTRFSQPVHNVFLLQLTELGLVGMLGLLAISWQMVFRWWRRVPLYVRSMWIFIAVSALFDHYWWSLQIGLLMLFLILGISFYTIKDRSGSE